MEFKKVIAEEKNFEVTFQKFPNLRVPSLLGLMLLQIRSKL